VKSADFTVPPEQCLAESLLSDAILAQSERVAPGNFLIDGRLSAPPRPTDSQILFQK
jgi:hypothetical protein